MSISGTLSIVGVPTVSNASASATVRVNTTGAAQTSVDATAFATGAEVLEVGVTGATLDVGSVRLTTDGVIRRFTTSSGLDGLSMSATDLSFTAQVGGAAAVSVEHGAGALLFVGTGVAGSLSATTTVDGAAFDGTIEFNTTEIGRAHV